jgi:interferon-induced GTP-binding protein Mx1
MSFGGGLTGAPKAASGSKLDEGIERDVRPWLDLIDTLRAMGIHQDLPLPQIAVMGDQSSGKSSVLESLSGVPFPRGSGLVTRCPTQLTMKRATKASAPWRARVSVARAGGHGGMTQGVAGCGEVRDKLELASAVERVSEALIALSPSGFSSDTVVVEIVAPSVPDLTLIDLPGLVRTNVEGQDPAVIVEVNNLIEAYLMQSRTIILAVVPANVDVATVDILERASNVDPHGERTIGVLTKVSHNAAPGPDTPPTRSSCRPGTSPPRTRDCR